MSTDVDIIGSKSQHDGVDSLENPKLKGNLYFAAPGWHFPDMEGPDLSTPLDELDRAAGELLARYTVYEIFDAPDDDEDDPAAPITSNDGEDNAVAVASPE